MSFSKPRFCLLALAVSMSTTAFADNVLIGLWRLNDGSGATAADSSGLGHNGTLTGDNGVLPTWVAGQPSLGGALKFVNDGTDHSYVNIPADPLLMIGLTQTNPWTIAFWSYEDSDGTGTFVATYGKAFCQDDGNGLYWDSGTPGDPNYYLWQPNLAAWQIATGITATLDDWVHWALVYDGTNLTIYQNGTSAFMYAVDSSLNYDTYQGNYQIGSPVNQDPAGNWNGMIQDFAIFNGALSQSEVQAITNGDFSAYLNTAGQPRIIVQPASQTVSVGLNATFTVEAQSFGPTSYQWKFNGGILPGQTNATLTLTNVQSANSGTYAVFIANANGQDQSDNVFLGVITPLTPQLVGLWLFNEGSGLIAHDTSGLGNNGTLTNLGGIPPTWVTGQPVGTALWFTNDGTDYSWVDVLPTNSLEIGLTASDAWTIALWTKEMDDGQGNYIATYGRLFNQDDGDGLQWESGATGDDQFYVWHNTLPAWMIGLGYTSAVIPLFDQWEHLALVYDGASVTMYRNGNTGPVGGKVSVPVTASLDYVDSPGYHGGIQIGTQLTVSATRNWNGMMADYAVFNGALTEAQVQMIMTNNFQPFLNNTPALSIVSTGGLLVISWGFGTLQSTASVTGGWADVTNATSPLIVNPSASQVFYRVRR